MLSPRFFGDDVLASCLTGHRMFDGSGDPPESVAVLQQALADLGFSVDVDGLFGPQTGAGVSAFKSGNGIIPSDPVVGPETMSALDATFAHELFDLKANDVAGSRFDLGSRIGTRVDIIDGFATCQFQNGICIEGAHSVAFAIPASVADAWVASGGLEGTLGEPMGDPHILDAATSVQEFTLGVRVFGGDQDFTLPLDLWEAGIGGLGMVGLPLGPPQPAAAAGSTFAQHETGVVLAASGLMPQPLPQAVFDLWTSLETASTSIGAPTAFGFPTVSGTTFPFALGSILMDAAATATAGAPVGADLQRYFLPGDVTQQLTPRVSSTVATPIIGGDKTLKAMKDDIAGTSGPNDFVYILSWHCNIDFEMVPGDLTSRLRPLLTSRAADGVQIRAMLWAGDPVPAPSVLAVLFTPGFAIPWALIKAYVRMKTSRRVNDPAIKFLNNLRAAGNDTAGILDDRHLPFGSHHQKVIIVGKGGQLIAYVGGIEPNIDRINPPVPDEPGSPLFDTAVRLEDAAAFLVLETFIKRWNLHPDKVGSNLRGEQAQLPLPVGGPMSVQITHTYGRGFPFINAVQTAATSIENGIKSAKKFFYLEDQYFVGTPRMTKAIVDALTVNPTLIGIVVLAAEDSVSDLPDLPFRRREFIRPIATAFPGRFLVFERLGQGSTLGPTAYVHSKLMIVDDEACFIGSANSNRRGWSHDTEIHATLVDTNGPGGINPGSRGVVRGFRCDLWAEHLVIPSAQLGDFAFCLTLWQAVISGQLVIIGGVLVDISNTVSVRAYNFNFVPPRFSVGGVPLPNRLLEIAWNNVEDPA